MSTQKKTNAAGFWVRYGMTISFILLLGTLFLIARKIEVREKTDIEIIRVNRGYIGYLDEAGRRNMEQDSILNVIFETTEVHYRIDSIILTGSTSLIYIQAANGIPQTLFPVLYTKKTGNYYGKKTDLWSLIFNSFKYR